MKRLGAGWFNVGSFVLGLLAWVLPILQLLGNKEIPSGRWGAICSLSLGACAVSLSFQIFYNYHLVKLEDWGALMDITGAVVQVSSVLLIGTVLLNLMVYRRNAMKST